MGLFGRSWFKVPSSRLVWCGATGGELSALHGDLVGFGKPARQWGVVAFHRAMTRALVFALSLLLVGALQAAAPRPNIVYLLVDDLGRADVGFMGCKDIPTPHIDALAKSGAVLDAFYVQPVCSPTRSALMTGRYPMRNGLQVGVIRPWAQYGLPLTERTLPQALKEVGYQTAIVGKWHLGTFQRGYLPTQRGFDHQYGPYLGAIDYFTHMREGGFDWHRDDQASQDEGYATELLAKEAVRLIRERDAAKPMFLYVPFNGVHSPWHAPEAALKKFAHLSGKRQAYAAMLSCVDDAIGQITAALDAAGMRDNTLIAFSSDNGGPSPGTVTDNGVLRAGKGTLYEGGTRVCAFATWKGHIKEGSVVKAPLHIADWYPTFLNLAGASLEQKAPLDGRDAWAAITEGAASPHDAILYNTTPKNGAIRMGDWKLVMNGQFSEVDGPEDAAKGKGKKKGKNKGPAKDSASAGGKVELFNLVEDISEKINLADKHPDKVAELKARLTALAAEALPPQGGDNQPKGFVPPKVWGE